MPTFVTVTRLWPLDLLRRCAVALIAKTWVANGVAERGPCAKVAQNLCVDKSTVSRTFKLFHTNGSVSKRPYPKESIQKTHHSCPATNI